MKALRVFGILVVLAGIAALLFSNYITDQVLQGKSQIAAGEQKVKKGKQLFSSNPYTKPLGEAITGSADKKIAKGKEEIAYYEELAQTLKTGGIIACIAGAGMFLFSFSNRGKGKSK